MPIHAHEFMSLDGVIESPSWTMPYGFPEAQAAAIARLTDASRAILLGRKTYEMFAPAWSTRTVDDDPGAPFFNDTKKYVVGAQQPSVTWQNTERLGGYDADRIRAVEQEVDGDVFVSGSGQLVRGLLRDGLLGGLHLFVFPVVLGTGDRLFHSGEEFSLALTDSETYENGVLHLTYGPAT